MLRGILTGGFWGTLMAGGALVTASLVAEQPAGNAPPATPSVDVPQIDGTAIPPARTQRDLPSLVADAGGAPQPSDTPQVDLSAPPSATPDTDTTPPETPDAAQSTAGLTPPATAPSATVEVASETPVLPNPQGTAPQVPLPEADVRLETTTPPAPEPEPEPEPEIGTVIVADPIIDPADGADGAIAQATPAEPVIVVDGGATETSDLVSNLPDQVAVADGITPATEPGETTGAPTEVIVIIDQDPVTDVAAPESVVTQTSEMPVVVATEASPELAPVTASDTTAPETTTPDTAAPDVVVQPPADPVVVVSDPAPTAPPEAPDTDTGPRIALQGGEATLPTGAATVRISRPDSAATPEAAAPEDTATDVETSPETGSEIDPDQPALVRYAEPVDNPDNLPLLSVILIDDGHLAGAVPAVVSIPFVVTVAIDPASPGAADLMASYRAAGIEVVAIANLPQGATPSDAAVALEAGFATLPEAVALLDTGSAGLQSDRDLMAQAIQRLSEDGRGFIVAPQGLGSGLRAAEAASVPAGLIYRDLDGDGQSAQVIRRFLDQAAFRARQQTGVILLGHVRADTLSAMTLWGTANRAGQVVLAPVSAVLAP